MRSSISAYDSSIIIVPFCSVAIYGSRHSLIALVHFLSVFSVRFLIPPFAMASGNLKAANVVFGKDFVESFTKVLYKSGAAIKVFQGAKNMLRTHGYAYTLQHVQPELFMMTSCKMVALWKDCRRIPT